MEPLLEGLLRSLGGSEANFLELCFGRFPYGNFNTKATSKKFRSPSGNFCPNPPKLPRSPSMSFSSREAGWKIVLPFQLVGFLHRAGPENLILVTGALGKFGPEQKTQNSGACPENQEKLRSAGLLQSSKTLESRKYTKKKHEIPNPGMAPENPKEKNTEKIQKLRDRYDWTTGVPDNGNDWRKFRAVPRSYPLRSLVLCFV